MMIPLLLLAISVVGLLQFTLFYLRAVLADVGAQPLSHRVREAGGVAGSAVCPNDFSTLVNLHEVTPWMEGGQSRLQLVRAYYRVLGTLSRLCDTRIPALTAWTNREMTTCSRYAAVLLDQRLEHNLVCAASVRSL